MQRAFPELLNDVRKTRACRRISTRRHRALIVLTAMLISLWGSMATATDDAADDDALPITLQATPSIVLKNHAVDLTGTAIGILNNHVSFSIEAPKASPPQSAELSGTVNEDGTFKVSFTPTVSGDYTVVATGPDDRGKAHAVFHAEDPAALSSRVTEALPKILDTSQKILEELTSKMQNLPPSPQKQPAIDKIRKMAAQVNEMNTYARQLSDNLAALIKAADDPKVTGPWKVVTDQDREQTIKYLGNADDLSVQAESKWHEVTQGELVCDNLEIAAEGIKIVSSMMNFFTNEAGEVVIAFAQDFVADYAGPKIEAVTGSKWAGIAYQQFTKNINTLSRETIPGVPGTVIKDKTYLKFDAGNLIGFFFDGSSLLLDHYMDQYCEQFAGPVTAHMHATFFHDNQVYWEYTYDVVAQITLHYPKDAAGATIPLKGRIEGFANNYQLRENALSVLYPNLMASAVQKRFYINPTTVPTGATMTRAMKGLYSAEGSGFSLLAVPSSFFFEITGTATQDKLSILVGAARRDTNDRTKVIALYLSPLGLHESFGIISYPLQYQPVHFLFEKAAPTGVFEVPLKTGEDVIIGSQEFKIKKEGPGGQAVGEYTVSIKACNPAC
jgi:hypothetical protein